MNSQDTGLNVPDRTQLDMEVILSEEDNTIYVKLTGFDDLEQADNYATYLHQNLPLLLFETEIKH
jgi:hypothetical protein